MAILRRAIDFVPDVGGLIPIPYNFDILAGEQVIGQMDRKFQLRDRYVLDLSGDPGKARPSPRDRARDRARHAAEPLASRRTPERSLTPSRPLSPKKSSSTPGVTMMHSRMRS